MRLKRQTVRVAAPRELTFEVVAAAGKQTGETDNGVLVEFETRLGDRVIKTIEEVQLRPPDSIAYRWLEGPLEGVEEEIRFEQGRAGETVMTYSGSLEGPCGIVGRLRTMLVVRPIFNRLVAEHLEQGKRMAEKRAERSRVHPRPVKG
ncbi:MAG: hypothetical protein ABR575_10195 [Actinomycetota bacterium]